MIDILLPVLGRPQNAAPLVASVESATTNRYEVVFLCSPGDEKQIEACQSTGARVEVVPWSAAFSDYPKKMNHGYQVTRSPWLMLAADDIDFEPKWDEIALENAEHYGVIGTNDQTNTNFADGRNSTHPLVRRSYLDILGGSADGPETLLHEGYDHNFCERELNGLAQHRDLYTYVPQSRIRHRHPLWRSAPMDATYRKGIRYFRRDQQLFFRRSHMWDFQGLNAAEKQTAMRFRIRV